jgi:hypothetical protein
MYRMSGRFDYTAFFNFYTDPNNVKIVTPLNVKYYSMDKKTKSTILRQAKTGNTAVTIGGKDYYITIYPPGSSSALPEIHFSLPERVVGSRDLWDNHYHFGVKNITTRNVSIVGNHGSRSVNVVFFHKTIQEPQNRNKRHQNCYFLPDQPIQDIVLIPDIDCLETKDSKMTRNFSLGTEDLTVVTELIRRPFYGVHYGGRRRRNAIRTRRRTKTKGRGTKRARP